MEQVGDIAIVEEGLTCFGCSYDLRGQGADGVCPECGMGVGESVREGRWDRAEGGWRRRVVRGAGWSAGEYLAMAVGMGVATVVSALARASYGSGRLGEWVAVGLFAAMGFCAAAGGWWATTPEPGRDGAAGWRRGAVRALSVLAGAVCGGLVVAVTRFAMDVDDEGSNASLVLTTALAGVNGVRGVLLIQHLRGLVRRVPGRRVRALGGVLAWAPVAGWWGMVPFWYVSFPGWMGELEPLIMIGFMGSLAVTGVYEGVLWWTLRRRRGEAR